MLKPLTVAEFNSLGDPAMKSSSILENLLSNLVRMIYACVVFSANAKSPF